MVILDLIKYIKKQGEIVIFCKVSSPKFSDSQIPWYEWENTLIWKA